MHRKKEVGILTFHRANNYGAVLQAYSLCNQINKMVDAQIIDYHSKKMDKDYYFIFSPKNLIKEIINFFKNPIDYILYKTRNCRFFLFRKKYLMLSKKFKNKTIGLANNNFNKIIVGSDQVWNPNCNKQDDNYFLTFAISKYSYAASFGVQSLEPLMETKIKPLLSNFNNLSLREKDGLYIVKKMNFSKNISNDCDPVFLTTKSEWEENFKLTKNKKEYILVYIMAKDNFSLNFARELSKKTGLQIVYVSPFNFSKNHRDFKTIKNAGPVMFLNLIYNAKYVVTTSFHGIAFSLIFNVPFYYELSRELNNKNSRLLTLESIFDISCYRVDSNKISDTYDWLAINSKIRKCRLDSLVTLENICNE